MTAKYKCVLANISVRFIYSQKIEYNVHDWIFLKISTKTPGTIKLIFTTHLIFKPYLIIYTCKFDAVYCGWTEGRRDLIDGWSKRNQQQQPRLLQVNTFPFLWSHVGSWSIYARVHIILAIIIYCGVSKLKIRLDMPQK